MFSAKALRFGQPYSPKNVPDPLLSPPDYLTEIESGATNGDGTINFNGQHDPS